MANVINDSAFRKTIEKQPTGAYLFFGEEDYLKAHALKTARSTVCPEPSFAVFNDISIDCTACSDLPTALADALSAPPMMADYKVVALTGFELPDKESELEGLLESIALTRELDFNLLIISAPSDALDEGEMLKKNPSEKIKKLCENLTPVHFPKVQPARLESWILRHFEHNKLRAELGVPKAMIELCGNDMYTLSGEIEKLSCYALAHSRDAVLLSDVELVCSPNDSFDTYALGSAIATGNHARALDVLAYKKARRVKPEIVMGELSKTLSDMLSVKILLNAKKNAGEIASALGFRTEGQVFAISNNLRDMTEGDLLRAVELCSAADTALKTNFSSSYLEIERFICSL